MPDLGLELHLGRLKGVLGGDDDIDLKNASFVWSAFRALYCSLEVFGILIVHGDCSNARSLVILAHFGQFLCKSRCLGRHGDSAHSSFHTQRQLGLLSSSVTSDDALGLGSVGSECAERAADER